MLVTPTGEDGRLLAAVRRGTMQPDMRGIGRQQTRNKTAALHDTPRRKPLCHHPSPSGKMIRGLATIAGRQSPCPVRRIADVDVDKVISCKVFRYVISRPASSGMWRIKIWQYWGYCRDSQCTLILAPAVTRSSFHSDLISCKMKYRHWILAWPEAVRRCHSRFRIC